MLIMFLEKLTLINFKNITQETFNFSSRVNCFVGDNGAGKTNIIDAIHYLSLCKSSFPMTDGQCLKHFADFFVLEGNYRSDRDRFEHIFCGYKKQVGKTLKRNSKEYERLSEHIGLLPLVIISPTDSFLISDAADERRRYINAFLSQLDREYLSSILKYNHILSERNKLLKIESTNSDLLYILDEQLCMYGGIVYRKRAELIEKLAPIVTKYYSFLSDDKDEVSLSYKSQLHDKDMRELLIDARVKDTVNQHTTCGVHRDDLKMSIGGHPIRKYGSQGQQKSFLIALKLAQYVIVANSLDEKPILLLDDLFDKLDISRVERLIKLVSSSDFDQIFITDCNKLRLERILEKNKIEYSLWVVGDGAVIK